MKYIIPTMIVLLSLLFVGVSMAAIVDRGESYHVTKGVFRTVSM